MPADWREEWKLTGRALDEDGQPVCGAQVLMFPDDGTRHVVETVLGEPLRVQARGSTAVDGRFTLDAQVLRRWNDAWSGRGGGPGRLCLRAKGFAGAIIPERDVRISEGDLGVVTLVRGVQVSGRVIDESGRPFPGIEVSVSIEGRGPGGTGRVSGDRRSWDAPQARLTTRTDAKGLYCLADVPPTRFNIRFRRLFSDGVRLTHDAGTPGERIDLEDVRLPTGLELEGRVVDAGGRPVPAARVLVKTVGGSVPDSVRLTAMLDRRDVVDPEDEARTDADGRFRFQGLACVPVWVIAQTDGLAPAICGPTWPGTASSVVVTLGPWRLFPVTILGADGAPAPGATLALTETALAAALPISTDGPGRFLVPADLSRRGYEARAPGHGRIRARLEDPGPWEIRLPRAATLSGRVHDTSGDGLPSVLVTVVTAGYDTSRRVSEALLTDAEGRFRFDNLSSRRWNLSAEAPGRTSVRTSVLVTDGGPAQPLEITIPAPARIEGRILGADDRVPPGVAGTRVYLDGADIIDTSTEVDRDGRFTFDNLPSGAVSLTRGGWTIRTTVESGRTTSVDLRVPLPSKVAGMVRLADGTPAPGAMVSWLRDIDGERDDETILLRTNSGHAECDGTGAYVLDLPASGRYTLVATTAGGGSSDAVHVDAAPGPSNTVWLALLPGRLQGYVVDADTGSPIAGARLTVSGDGEPVTTEADGAFRLDGIAPKPVTVNVEARGYLPRDIEVDGPHEAGVPRGGLRLELSPAASLTVSVSSTAGRPVENMMLVVIWRRETEGSWANASMLATAYTKQGVARVTGLPPGDFGVTVSDQGTTRTEDGPLDVEGARLVPIPVRLVAGAEARLDAIVR